MNVTCKAPGEWTRSSPHILHLQLLSQRMPYMAGTLINCIAGACECLSAVADTLLTRFDK